MLSYTGVSTCITVIRCQSADHDEEKQNHQWGVPPDADRAVQVKLATWELLVLLASSQDPARETYIYYTITSGFGKKTNTMLAAMGLLQALEAKGLEARACT